MNDDLRKKRSESAEGRGLARRAWDRYLDTAYSATDGIRRDAVARLTARWSADMLGFWASWHLYGGFEGLERAGWHRATIYRKLKRFRTIFGMHPDEYKVVGVQLDPVAFWEHYLEAKGSEE
ncbi:MAG: hypothetical protein WEA29_06890 [Acidimicrobiia bacterium]